MMSDCDEWREWAKQPHLPDFIKVSLKSIYDQFKDQLNDDQLGALSAAIFFDFRGPNPDDRPAVEARIRELIAQNPEWATAISKFADRYIP